MAVGVWHPVRAEEIVVVPKLVGLLIALLAEWIVWIIQLGQRQSNATLEGIRYSTIAKTVNIDEAKRLLGYRPIYSMQEDLDRSVAWFIANKKTE